MNLAIKLQESYSRGELLLRTIFGFFYIVIPHSFLLFFVGIWSAMLGFITFWIVLFSGRFPQSFFEFQLKMMRWGVRLQASLGNLMDGYPVFGLVPSDEKVTLEADFPERSSRGLVLLRAFFGWLYLLIPHGFCLFFRFIATGVLTFLSWWVVLFTGKYPESWHEFNVGSIRWATRLHLYNSLMTDKYPPFSGKA
jgi:hypothetical protein